MTSKLTILFAPGYGWSRLNACHGLAEELLTRGHRIVFAIDKTYRGQVAKYGFEEVVHCVPNEVINRQSEGEQWGRYVADNADARKGNSLQITADYYVPKLARELAECRALNHHYRSVVDVIHPDVIVVDASVCAPALIACDIPWVCLTSQTPLLALNDPTLPPPFSGMSYKADMEDWIKYSMQMNEKFANLKQDINEWYISQRSPHLLSTQLTINSSYLNIYVSPKELDYYSDNTLLSHNWIRVDSLVSRVKAIDDTFEMPAKLADKPGKLVLVNMGHIGTGDLVLMRKLVDNLSNSEHRYIIVTGSIGDKLNLPANIWGKSHLPILQILPHVDLLITNGCNQSVVEALYNGKPLIVLPLFGHHFESAQRIKELSLGLTLNPYTCGMTSLVASVDALVDDKVLLRRVTRIANRLHASTDTTRAATLVENICQ